MNHAHDLWKSWLAGLPGPAVLLGYLSGAMQAVAPLLQLAILLLTIVSLIYSIRVSRKRLKDKKLPSDDLP